MQLSRQETIRGLVLDVSSCKADDPQSLPVSTRGEFYVQTSGSASFAGRWAERSQAPRLSHVRTNSVSTDMTHVCCIKGTGKLVMQRVIFFFFYKKRKKLLKSMFLYLTCASRSFPDPPTTLKIPNYNLRLYICIHIHICLISLILNINQNTLKYHKRQPTFFPFSHKSV